MEQPQTRKLPILESNIDQLVQELHQLASQVKQSDQHQQREGSPGGQGQYFVATGR